MFSPNTSEELPTRARLLRRFLIGLRPSMLAAFIKKLANIQRVVISTHVGMFWVDPISNIGDALIRSGIYEASMVETMRRLLSQGSIFVDLGANEGYFSVVAASIVGATGHVIAVEPQARLKSVLLQNFRLNNIETIALFDVAVSNSSEIAQLHLTPSTNTGSSSLTRPTRYWLPTQSVQTVTLAQLFEDAGITHVHLMKMDIEGFEYEAIMGSQALFESGKVRALALELHPTQMRKRGLDPGTLLAFLGQCGYRKEPSFENLVFIHRSVGNLSSPGS